MLPTWPRPLWEEPTGLSYHQRKSLWRKPGPAPLLAPWAGASLLSQLGQGPDLGRSPEPGSRSLPSKGSRPRSAQRAPVPEEESQGDVRAEGREGREGGCQGVGPAPGREGLRSGRVSGREERGGWGVSGGQPWGLRSHTATRRSVEEWATSQKEEKALG